jgi:hypothetical protein
MIEVTAAAEEQYTQQIALAAQSSVWLTGGCTSWYRDRDNGRLTLLWPGTADSFRRRNGVFDMGPFALRRVKQ